MVGTKLQRRSDRESFRVTGRDGWHWVLSPDTHGPAISASPLECSELFSVVGEEVEIPAADLQAGWERLAADHFVSVYPTGPREPAPLTPEEQIEAHEYSAERIAGDTRLLWAFTSGRLAIDASTAGRVDRLLAKRGA